MDLKMRRIWLWFNILLVFGGLILCLTGLLGEKGAELLQALGWNAHPGAGYRVMLTGFIMLLAGLGLIYCQR